MRTTAWSITAVLAAAVPALATISCPAQNQTTYTNTNGDTYLIECGIDHAGGDLPNDGQYTPSLDACISLCSNTTDCVDVSWVQGLPDGPCYYKSSLGQAVLDSRIWGAKLLSKAPVVSTSVSVMTSTVSSSTITSTSTIVTTISSASVLPTGPATPFCPNLDGTQYTDSCGAVYVIECGVDHSGGDIPNGMQYTTGLDGCMALCSSNSECVDVSWVPGLPQGPCYPKSVLGAANQNSNVWGARQISQCVVSSSSSQSATSGSSSSSGSVTTFSSSTTSASASSSSSSSSSASSTTCGTVPTYTAGTLPNCVPCQGQPGTGQFCGYDINTNYYENYPITCNVVTYDFEITNATISPDGIERIGLVVNGQFPGPAIKASWGDTVVVTVKNSMQNNGTTIHFHGVRQLNNNMNDGVPSLTQCPIAPGESMTYTWVASQYGTSWYHSHFAIQAWEGVLGPIMIDGPSSAPFDVDLGAYVLSDWTHATVDSMYDLAQNATPIPGSTSGATYGGPQSMDNGLINGHNTWNDGGALNTTVGTRLEAATFTPGQSYLLRIINTAIQSTFAFSIDGHTLTVTSTDFVPIEPYETDVLFINIGQRYNVIVNANAAVDNYWMRADNQQSCTNMIQNRDVKAIVRYDGSPTGVDPTSTSNNYTDACVDEPYASLVPVVPLNAGPANFTEGALDVIVQANSAQLYKWYLSGSDKPSLIVFYSSNTDCI